MTDIKLPVRKEKSPSHAYRDKWIVVGHDGGSVCGCANESHADAIVLALNERERLRQALEFYANKLNYRVLADDNDDSVIGEDAGYTARAALRPEDKP